MYSLRINSNCDLLTESICFVFMTFSRTISLIKLLSSINLKSHSKGVSQKLPITESHDYATTECSVYKYIKYYTYGY